jgi:hypothetical protein
MEDINYYWGIPDATVSFCEDKYAKYFWIAEYHNTISASCYIITGLFMIRIGFDFFGYLLCCVGLGAMLLHATLKHWCQMGDEISMLVLSFYVLVELRPQTNRYIIYPLIISYCLFSKYFMIFLLLFGGLQVLLAKHVKTRINATNKKWLMLYFVSFITGTGCWVLDQICNTQFGSGLEPYQFHAWWHFFTSISIGFAFTALLIPSVH